MPEHAVELVSQALGEAGKKVRGSRIALLGIAYKPGIRDVQLTPVEKIVKRLREMGASLVIYDPRFPGEFVLGCAVEMSVSSAVKDADCVVIGTAHDEFRHLTLTSLAHLMKEKPAFVDTGRVLNPARVSKAGFVFRGVGRRIT